MHIRELAERTATPERQIRYMIAEGFVPPPRGGRARADYGEDHVAAIRRYTVLRRRGLPPQAIRVLIAGDAAVPFELAPGITLSVAPELLGAGVDRAALAARIKDVLDDIFLENDDEKSDRDPLR